MDPRESSATVSQTSPTAASQDATTPSSLSSTTDIPVPVITIPPTPDDTSSDRRAALIHLYFLILFFGAAIIAIAYLVLRRRRRKKLLQRQQHGRSALAEDAGRWTRLSGSGRHWTSGRPEEGLDERGEAPPPYSGSQDQKADTISLQARAVSADRNEPFSDQSTSGRSAGLAVPPRTHQAIMRNHPPVYEEVDPSRSNLSLDPHPTHP